MFFLTLFLIFHCKCIEIQLIFLYIDFVPCNMAKSFISSSGFLVNSSGYFNM